MAQRTPDAFAPEARVFNLTLQQRLYVVLTGLFVAVLLTADMVAGKYFMFGGLQLSVGIIPFPIAFLLTDIVNEYYGRRGAHFLTGVGMAMLVVAYVIIYIGRILPTAVDSPVPQSAFDGVFGISGRLFAASLAAYLIGQIADINTFHLTKRITQSKHLWLRALGSTTLSQIIDTIFVNFGALAGLKTPGEIMTITISSYVYKMAVAAILTPLVYLAHEIITSRLGIEPAPFDEPDEE